MEIDVFKAPDRECYAVAIDDTYLYIPVVSTVFESGTNDPLKVANRVVSTGIIGFWTCYDDGGTLLWHLIRMEDVPELWQKAIDALVERLTQR
jgi:hypothetical protein